MTAAVGALVCAGAHLRAQESAPDASGTNTAGFSGTVTDTAGKPVAGATVEYWRYGENPANIFQPGMPEMEKQTATTGADGAFSFPVSAGAGILLAQKPGLAPAWKLLNQMPNSARATEGKLVLTPPGILAGVVMDESNRPVANAGVYVAMAVGEKSFNNGVMMFNVLFGQPARDHFSAPTDAAGHFRIENFPTNAVAMLAVESPGKVLHPPEQESYNLEQAGYRAGQEDIKLSVEPAGGIEGKIFVGENNQPLPDAQLMLLPDEPRSFMVEATTPVKSGANGGFHFDRVLAGSYRIQFFPGPKNDSGWVAEMVPVTVTAGQTTRAVQVKAVRGALLEVTVLGQADRKPQPKVNVTASMDESKFHGISDTNGVAKVFVLPGNYQVSAFRQQPRLAGQTSATVEAGKTNRVEIEMAEMAGGPMGSAPAIKISGVVHLPDGKPAAGASVQLVGGFSPRGDGLQTAADGKFEAEWNPRQFGGQNDSTACILVRDAEHNLAVAQDLDEDTTNLDLKLAPGLVLVGRAEAGGKPLTNATAQIVFWIGHRGMWLQGLARTNTPGQYEIPALPPGRKYGVTVSAPGYGQRQNNNLEIFTEAGRQELDTVELKPANLKLAGQVLDADDKPVARCNVSLFGEDQPSANTRTDRDGRFSFAHVCEGTLHISANSQRAFGSVSAEGGDTNVVLHLGENMSYSPDSKPHPLRGVVTDADGRPVAGAQVAVFPNNGAHWVRTGTNGAYSLSWSLQSWQLQNGGALLVFRDPARNLAGTEELPEETTNLNVKLKPALAFSGQVKNADGTPLITAQVGLWLKAGNSYEQLDEQMTSPVNAEGRFEIKCLPPDAPYLVYASAKGYGKGQQQLQPDYESNRVELATFVLKHTDRVIAGKVLKDDDKPAAGVTVQLNGEDQPDGNLTTDSQGRFHFQVCEGQIRLFAYSQNGGGNAQATVEAGDTNIVMTLGSQPGNVREAPRRTALKGSPLPDLATVNLPGDAAPAGKPVLLCLFDASQRPSRHVIRQLEEQAAALRQQGVAVLGVQAAVISDETFSEWKNAGPVSFPVGRVMEKSEKSKWASAVSALPWLILTDANHRVAAEGFALDELDAQVKNLAK
ncbi:MAG: carboxypeptidase regulatory-like domain-containing protein [Limisphaerales bacterium]